MNEKLMVEYQLPVWSEKVGVVYAFKVTLLEGGWEIINPPVVGGICDKYGKYIEEKENRKITPEGLEECFSQDYIIFPSNIKYFFSGLHYRISNGEFSCPEDVQEKFNEIGNWIIKLNKEAPKNIEI